ncbi:TPA: hypothetical protein QDB28_005685 [Burkholderia vietnamiensis]|nr:hypothetical protein [Burkholderia vietnamiensis]
MWLTLSDAFLSIVSIPGDAEHLKVRARRKGDIERVFKDCSIKVERTPGRDYLYRAVIPRALVGLVVSEHVMSINYDNFKNSVRDGRLHTACNRVWHVMADLQEIPPYARDTRVPARRVAPAKKSVVTQ